MLAADCNRAVTGRWFRSPYQEYTSRHTPRHVYGFYNVSRGAALQGDRVLRPFTARYDAWAEELTPARAAATAARRLAASAHWTVGPAAALAAWFCAPWLFAAGPRRTDALLVAGAAACLHLAHVPYWYAGIMNFHYVFESVLAYAVLLGCGLALWAERTEPPARPLRRFVRSAAPLAVWLAGVGQGWTDLGGEIANLRFARERYERFEREVVDRAARPALVLVRPDPSDLHIDYVTNPPDLAADVLRGRFDAAAPPLDEIRAAFPARRLYWFDARSFRFRPIEPSEPDPRSTAPGGPAQ